MRSMAAKTIKINAETRNHPANCPKYRIKNGRIKYPMVCRDSVMLCTQGRIKLTKTTENRESIGISSITVTSHSRLKKKGTPIKTLAIDAVIVKMIKEIREITTEISTQTVIFALKMDFAFIEERNSVSKVPCSFSFTKAQEAEATAQTMGTIKYKTGQTKEVNTVTQKGRLVEKSMPIIF